MTSAAHGTFTVTITAEPPYDAATGATLARLSIAKQFQGDLEGSGTVQMLSAFTAVEGSGGYVAIERVIGTLHGHKGSFVLQHSGTMTRSKPQLTVSVVPDSGTADLKGIAGTMTIEIVDDKHLYGFNYTIDPLP
jgi:Protein of unknown function (DUF3224)